MPRQVAFVALLFACGSAKKLAPLPVTSPDVQAGSATATDSGGVAGAAASAEFMKEFSKNGFELSGGEYWPYIGSVDIKYPEEVLWGFYPKKGVIAPGETDANPASATKEAIACAEKAYRELVEFVDSKPALLAQLAKDEQKAGFSNKFYLWTNDYSKAADPYPPGAQNGANQQTLGSGIRPAKFWYWKRKELKPDRPPGFWKWESSLDQKGVCHTPDPKQVEEFLRATASEMDEIATVPSECRGLALSVTVPHKCSTKQTAPQLEKDAFEATLTAEGNAKGYKLVAVVKSKKALPQRFSFALGEVTVKTAAGEPLPKTVCAPNMNAAKVGYSTNAQFVLDNQGSLTYSESRPSTYTDCSKKQQPLKPGQYQISVSSSAGRLSTTLTIK